MEPHLPVLLKEVLQYMTPKDGEVYVDGTFGAGGYTKAILDAANCKVYAIDCDPNVAIHAEKIAAEYKDRFKLLPGKFSHMAELLSAEGVERVNGVVLDIGISSMQVDQAERGFSFMREGPLDMRMNGEGMDAASFINNASEAELADVLYNFGGEKKSRYIAKAVLQARVKAPISTTTEFAEIVRSAVRGKKGNIDPATRSFQAVRIWINDELGELERALCAAKKILAPSGRLVVVSFHSLEDSIIKNFFNSGSGKQEGLSRHMPVIATETQKPEIELITRKVVIPTDEEVENNPRARSAKLRAARKM